MFLTGSVKLNRRASPESDTTGGGDTADGAAGAGGAGSEGSAGDVASISGVGRASDKCSSSTQCIRLSISFVRTEGLSSPWAAIAVGLVSEKM
jgi:hypothetical protein